MIGTHWNMQDLVMCQMLSPHTTHVIETSVSETFDRLN